VDLPTDLSKLKIILYPNPVLKRQCEPVVEFGDELRRLADRMFELMREVRGVGLAAPQVGVPIRLFVCNATGQPGDDMICVNPKLDSLSGSVESQEGCLSIPGVTVNLRRAETAVIQACDADGARFSHEAKGLLARIWQHESDHLDGRLIIDYMSATDEIANRRALRELLKGSAAAR